MKKNIQRILPKLFNVLLGIGMILWLLNPSEVLAANISFQENAVTNISNNDARISAKVINSDKLNVTETGFYLGTSSGALSKSSRNDSGSWKYSKITVGYTMSQYWEALSENTTYYYRFYVIANGVEYTSEEYSFKTTGGSVAKAGLSFYGNNVTDVTENNGRINAKISNPDGRRVTETGFYIGTSQNLSKNGMNDQCKLTNSTITVGYTMSKYYGILEPGTTYYYKFYAIGDGEEFSSEIYSFTTVSTQTAEPTPTPQPAPKPGPTPEPKPQTAKAKLTFGDNAVTDVTENNGRISAKISNPDGRRVTETGFYIGTSEQLYQNSKHDDCDYSNTTITVGYTMSKYYGILEPGTTYYYMFYAVGDGEEFFSDIYYFTTAKVQQSEPQTNPGSGNGGTAEEKSKISFSVTEVKDITHETARIGAKVNNPDKEKITETGFYYGTSKSDLTKSLKADTGNWKTGISVSYNVGDYARICLMENTTYYYQFYVVSEGKEVVSEISTFTTQKKAESKSSIQFEIKLVTEITSDNARIRAKINNSEKEKITETGFYIGTGKSQLIKNIKNDKGNWSSNLDVSYSLKTYYNQNLKPDTIYYYQFYIVANGKEYCSDIAEFKTTEIKKEEVGIGKYKEINWWNTLWDNVTDFTPKTAQTPWVVQEKNGCSIASLAMCVMIKEIEGLSTLEPKKALDKVKADNKNSLYMSGDTWKKYKYNNTISYPSYEQIYECLKSGPVICHKTFTNQDNKKDCPHFSVIVGYKGSVDRLEATGFVVKDVTNYEGIRKRNKNLAIWATDRLPYEKNIVFDRINYFKD